MSTRSDMVMPEIALEVNGVAYLGWTALEVETAIDMMAGTFDLQLATRERTSAMAWPLADGMSCRITLGDEVLLTGHIDLVARSLTPEEYEVRVQGRDATADLVDCSAIHQPGSWTNRRLEAIAAELLEPFGIGLDLVGDNPATVTGAPFTRFALQQGESVFDAIERMARYRGVVAFSTGDGRLKLGNPDSGERAGQIVEGQNLLSGDATRSQSERYSRYIVKGQSSGDDQRSGRAVTQVNGDATDAAVARYRPLLLIGEEQADDATLRERAQWEATVRAGRAQPARLSVPGWSDDFGRAWRPGRRAACQCPSLGIDGDMLIERVSLQRDAKQGTISLIDLVPPGAWTQLAQAEAAQ